MATPIRQIQTPDNTVHDIQGMEYIVGTQSASTNLWTGVSQVDEIYDGMAINYKLPVAGTTNSNSHYSTTTVSTLELFDKNGTSLGWHPVFRNAGTVFTTIYPVNSVLPLVFDADYSSTVNSITHTGAWKIADYDSNDNTIGYRVRTNTQQMAMSGAMYRYRLFFTSADGKKYVPANTSSSINATSSRTVNQTPIDPFGPMFYYSNTSAVSSGSKPGATYQYQQYDGVTLGYSFNRTGAALTLTTSAPVYLKCAPQADGSAIMDANTPIVQSLPNTEDGKIYIFLGIATSATVIQFELDHPVYYYKNNAIRMWTNAQETDLSDYEKKIKRINLGTYSNIPQQLFYGIDWNADESISQVIQDVNNGYEVYLLASVQIQNVSGTIDIMAPYQRQVWSGGGYTFYTYGTNSASNPRLFLIGIVFSEDGFGDYNSFIYCQEVAKYGADISLFNNDAGYITGITSADVTTALGFTPSAEGHSHAWGDITNPPSSFTPSAHTHDYSKVSITSNSKGPVAGTITIDEITTTLKTGINNTPSANSNYYMLGITSNTDATLTKTKVGYIKNGDTSTITIGGPGNKKSSLDYTSLSLADQDNSHTYIGTIKTVNSLTANRTYTLQDKSGTIALTSDITDAIGGITSFDYTTTTTLPASGSKGTIYLVGHTHGTNDVYDEYIYVGSSWEKIGNTDIDLSNYVPTSRTINNKSLTTNIELDYQDVGAAPVSHSHPWADITNPPSSYTPTAHSHPVTTSTTTVVTGVGSNGTTSALTGVKFTSTTTALTSVVATTTSIYPAANVTALTSVTRSTTSIYPAANVTAITSVTGSTMTMYGTGTVADVMSAPTVVNNVLSWTLVSTANATGATVVKSVTTSGQSIRGTATTVVNAVTIGAGSSVRASAVTVATGALTTKTATVGTGVGNDGTATVLTGVKASSTATAITGITVSNNT